jgi:hypothetical protein
MEFSRKKLPKEAAETLRICPVETVRPFVFMPAPVYVFMKLNEKFVSVKAPLDFFTPEDLERLRPFEAFFFPESIDAAAPFRSAARKVRALLAWKPKPPAEAGELYPTPALPPAPYELSDAVLRIIGPLWSKPNIELEPFFLTVFASELCGPLPGAMLKAARDRDVISYERAAVVSSWAMFIALHLGHCQLAYLDRLRIAIFEEIAGGMPGMASGRGGEAAEILALARESATGPNAIIHGGALLRREERVAQKMNSRLARVGKQLATDGVVATIRGPKGFVDV